MVTLQEYQWILTNVTVSKVEMKWLSKLKMNGGQWEN